MSDNEIPTQDDRDTEGHRMAPYSAIGETNDTAGDDAEGDDTGGHRMAPYSVMGETNETEGDGSQRI
jgi:hypothetical protein